MLCLGSIGMAHVISELSNKGVDLMVIFLKFLCKITW